jgi:hypothetical protein
MRWSKQGQIYFVDNSEPLLETHASNPLAVLLRDDVYRIYYSGRNKDNKSSISYVDYDIEKRIIINNYKKPFIRFGKPDSFYSHGISIGNVWVNNETYHLGFMGWQHKDGLHWRGDIGKISLADNKVEKISLLLGSSLEDPISLSYPFVLLEDGKYKMWYGSTVSWSSENGEMIHVIKFATSDDGEKWKTHGIAIPYEIGVAQAFSRPTVLKIQDKYHMWFSFRGSQDKTYRIGYAVSCDGVNWEKQNPGIDVGQTGWDSEMICYPFVFRHKQKIYMLYNGNKYGKYGFGLAEAYS